MARPDSTGGMQESGRATGPYLAIFKAAGLPSEAAFNVTPGDARYGWTCITHIMNVAEERIRRK